MTPAQIRIVQRTFAQLEYNATDFSAIFYDRLFTLAPETRALFRSDLKAQHAKFMKVVAEVVKLHLRALISLPVTSKAGTQSAIPGADWAGQMHYAYGVKMEHYDVMKQALLWALEQSLGRDFNQDAADAWSSAYDILADAMRSGVDPDALETDDTRASRSGDIADTTAATAFLKELGERADTGDDE